MTQRAFNPQWGVGEVATIKGFGEMIGGTSYKVNEPVATRLNDQITAGSTQFIETAPAAEPEPDPAIENTDPGI